jgi:hypothetical protein
MNSVTQPPVHANHYIRDITLVGAAYLTMFGFLLWAIIHGGDRHQMFQRSGALGVLLAVVSEYLINEDHRTLLASGHNKKVGDIFDAIARTAWEQRALMFAHFAIIVGTLVWAYGDLPFASRM